MKAFYNDNEPYVVEWLKNLIAAGHITEGDVSGTSIVDLEAWQVAGYQQAHFFAGIGGWDYALKLAGWPEEIPVWTGSCPCQPFSVAGKRKGESDDRHLWPYFRRLIEACGPPVVFGEQVASADGRLWLAGVQADVEALGYQFAAADLCAAGVGAPHIRQRLFWVAYSERDTRGARRLTVESGESTGTEAAGASAELGRCSDLSGLGDTNNKRSQGRIIGGHSTGQWTPWASSLGSLVPCADGKARRVEPGLQPLAHGVPARVGKLRAYGNAIVPQVAAEFIRSFMEAVQLV